jgi:hypothetical protein
VFERSLKKVADPVFSAIPKYATQIDISIGIDGDSIVQGARVKDWSLGEIHINLQFTLIVPAKARFE